MTPRWFGAFGAVAVLVGVLSLFAGISALRAGSYVAGVAGIGGFVATFAILAVIGKSVSRRIDITTEGISELQKGRLVAIAWSEVHDFRFAGVRMTAAGIVDFNSSVTVTVTTPDGRSITVQEVKVPGGARTMPNQGACKVIEQQSTASNWPRLRAKLAAGNTVAFGEVALTKESIRVDGTVYPLVQVLEVSVANGVLNLKVQGKWLAAKTRVRDLVNYPSLLLALEEFRALKRVG